MGSLSLRNIHKSYGETAVIKGLNLEVHDGEFLVLVGPSGCGKSTALRMIAGLEDVTAGELFIDGRLSNDIHPADRGAAMVFQSYALYPHMTVADNMGFSLKMAGVSNADRQARVLQAAESLQISNLLERFPKELSGGQRQRVAIGRAIVRKPTVFLFDEPLSNLDAALRVSMRIELTRLHQELKTTMIYVTHDQVEAMTMGDRIAIFNQGKIEQLGSPLSLYQKPANLFVAGFLGAPKINLIEKPHESSSAAHRQLWSALTQHLTREPHTIGIRPEQCKVSHTPNGVQASVTLAEHLGDSSILYLKIEGLQSLFNLKLDANASKVQNGDSLFISAEPQHVLAFDAAGQNMDLQ
jgi:multiple sugar transport system ATP-binding protein